MISVSIKVDTSKFDRMMSDFPAAMARARTRALKDIGQHVASDATEAFRTASLRPSPWAPRKDKKATHPLLIKSGNLRQSIRWRLSGPDTVVVGSPMKYAPYHQLGTKKMPARPFFPVDKAGRLTPRIMRKIQADVQKAYTAELRKLGG